MNYQFIPFQKTYEKTSGIEGFMPDVLEVISIGVNTARLDEPLAYVVVIEGQAEVLHSKKAKFFKENYKPKN